MKSEWIDGIVEKNKPLQSCWKTRKKKRMREMMKHFDSGLGTERINRSINKKPLPGGQWKKQL